MVTIDGRMAQHRNVVLLLKPVEVHFEADHRCRHQSVVLVIEDDPPIHPNGSESCSARPGTEIGDNSIWWTEPMYHLHPFLHAVFLGPPW